MIWNCWQWIVGGKHGRLSGSDPRLEIVAKALCIYPVGPSDFNWCCPGPMCHKRCQIEAGKFCKAYDAIRAVDEQREKETVAPWTANPRLDTATKALRAMRDRPVDDPTVSDAEDFLAMYDAIRALDEQQAQNAGSSGVLNERAVCDGLFEGAPATPVEADPPWLDEAISQCFGPANRLLTWDQARAILKNTLAFAAAKARAGG